MSRDFEIVVHGRRAEDLIHVFGSNRVCVRSPVPHWAILPGIGPALVYEADLDLITLEQRARLVTLIAERFGLPETEVERELDAHGLPLLADECSVVVHNPQRWLD